MNLKERRRKIKLFKSNCCNSEFKPKSNGLWTYYICNSCFNKTQPIYNKETLDLYGRIIKLKLK